MTSPLPWSVVPPEAGAGKRTGTLRASNAELAALAAPLEVLSVEELTASYEIEPLHKGRYRLTGQIDARLTQACVVTLEPVPAAISEPLRVELRPGEEIAPPSGREDQEVLAAVDVEPFEGGSVDLGRIVFEYLSAGLDPYPRKPDAEFSWKDPKAAEDGGPFAALAKLNRGQ